MTERTRPYSPGHARRLRAAARKIAEAVQRVADAAPAIEAARAEWRHPSQRGRPNEQPTPPRAEPPPAQRITISRRASCIMKSEGLYNPALHRIEGEPDVPPPPEPPKPSPLAFDVGEKHLLFRRTRMRPPHGGASSADSPRHHLGIWEEFDPSRKTHCVPYSPPACSTLILER
jgi:hypothetical protein